MIDGSKDKRKERDKAFLRICISIGQKERTDMKTDIFVEKG
jgi:hypothetical protein